MLTTATRPTTRPTTRLKLPPLHPRQREIARSDARFLVAACGRRFGKTRAGAAMCLMTAANGGRAWWVAPTYRMSEVGWRVIRQLALQVPGTELRYGDRAVRLPGGGEVVVRSADNPDSLRGEGLDFVVMDECAFMAAEAWPEAIRPALSDRRGRALFISTPKGRNWLYDLWLRGMDAAEQDWASWQLPTSANPFIDPAEIEAARQLLPDDIFRQEYLAEFLAESGENTFRREWWTERNRYAAGDLDVAGRVLAYYQSWDTAEEAGDDNAWTVGVTLALMRDYRVAVSHVYRARMTFDALPGTIESVARQFADGGKLRGVVIEDKSSGKSARYTLQASAPEWLRGLIVPFRPHGSKESRASAASVWCRNGMVLLPHPGPAWLLDFEDELFAFPLSRFADQVDAFGQGVLFLENYLAEGYKARGGGRV